MISEIAGQKVKISSTSKTCDISDDPPLALVAGIYEEQANLSLLQSFECLGIRSKILFRFIKKPDSISCVRLFVRLAEPICNETI